MHISVQKFLCSKESTLMKSSYFFYAKILINKKVIDNIHEAVF